MSKIGTFNKAVSESLNREDETYTAIFGNEDFTASSPVTQSSDFNCGALCNELEYLRTVSDYYVQSFDLDIAEDDNLGKLIEGFVDLPRRNRAEADSVYRKRFRSIVTAQTNHRRLTKWAIIDALSHFITDLDTLQIIEQFDSSNLYFQVRIEGAQDFDTVIFLNNTNQAYVDQNFVGGEGVGQLISYIGEIIERIRAAGVDFDILFISQSRDTKTSDTIIGTVQKYYTSDSVIKVTVSFTKTSDATVA